MNASVVRGNPGEREFAKLRFAAGRADAALFAWINKHTDAVLRVLGGVVRGGKAVAPAPAKPVSIAKPAAPPKPTKSATPTSSTTPPATLPTLHQRVIVATRQGDEPGEVYSVVQRGTYALITVALDRGGYVQWSSFEDVAWKPETTEIRE
jgi:hypothetical protein